MKLTDLFNTYCDKRLKLCSHNTHRLYRHSIAAFEKTIGRECYVSDLSDDNIQSHMERLVGNGLSRATANKDCAQLCAIWRWANRQNIVVPKTSESTVWEHLIQCISTLLASSAVRNVQHCSYFLNRIA